MCCISCYHSLSVSTFRGEGGERRDGRGDRSEAEREGEGRGERVGRGVVGWWMGDGGEEGKRCSGTHDHGERTDLSLTQLVAGDTIHDRGHVQIHARLRYLAALRYGFMLCSSILCSKKRRCGGRSGAHG
jgi:hypothetical protein